MTKYINPPNGLLDKILLRIRKEERILAVWKTIFISVFILCSITGFVPALMLLLSDFSQSEFLDFFSLLFYDFNSVMTYWKSFTMILLETLPVASIVIFLAVILALLQSLKFLNRNIKIIKRQQLAIN